MSDSFPEQAAGQSGHSVRGMEVAGRQYYGGGFVECCEGRVDPLFLLTIVAGAGS